MEGVDPAHHIRPFLLRFAGRDLEDSFNAESILQELPTIRVFVLAGILLYALFGILDFVAFPGTYENIWLIRFGMVLPLLLAVYIFSHTGIFVRFAQWGLTTATFGAGLGIIGMTAIGGPPANAYYYAGLIMVVIYCSSLIRLRWTNATISSALLVLLYQPVALWINPIPHHLLISNDFFLLMSAAVGAFSSYVQELHLRREFLNAKMLKMETERSIELMREAQAADRAKSEFLAVMSHELRTPLNAIIGFSEIIKSQAFGPVGSPQYVEYIEDIHDSGEQLLKIISDVLDLSHAEVGKLEVHDEEIDLIDLLNRCCRMHSTKAAELGVRLSLKTEKDGSSEVIGDSRLLKQLFLSLIGNAVKFTPSGGSVVVTPAMNEDGSYAVTVSDTGIGIAKKDIEEVLKPFTQVEAAYNRKHGGAGLGLPLSKKIAELHGGTLDIQSTVGAGTSVTLTLPAERVTCLEAEESGAA